MPGTRQNPARSSWSLAAVVFFLLTLYALSVAVRAIDVGIGYAVWAGIGAAGAALLGPAFFDETLTPPVVSRRGGPDRGPPPAGLTPGGR